MSEPSTPAEAGEYLAAIAPAMEPNDRLQLFTIFRRYGMSVRQARQLLGLTRHDATEVAQAINDQLDRLRT
jgi:ribosome-binding protein aMBF1 (putative translation factor)